MRNKKKTNVNRKKSMAILGIAFIVLVIAVAALVVRRYAPSTERMKLTDYFVISKDNECAVILNSSYDKSDSEDATNAIMNNGRVYLNLSYLKNKIDDGYVFDSTENVLRYATDNALVTANLNSADYTVDRQGQTANDSVIISEGQTFYVNLDWVKNFSDLQYKTYKNPNRVVIETAGWKRGVATITGNTKIRRNGGVKSKILQDVKKGTTVTVVENYGKWSKVVSKQGVIGCVENKKLSKQKTSAVKKTLEERKYNHMKFNGEISLGWHQVNGTAGNASLTTILNNAKGMNVISPTWYVIKDNQGNISDYSSAAYVQQCHQKQVQVWALVSNISNNSVDTTAVLNTTSSRDNLVNSLIASAITTNVDGINVDLESLSGDAKDGYIQFIKELSLKCEKNDLILSVDNYAPTGSSQHYQRKIQAEYADYLVLMGYDEHYGGSKEAGSVASIDWVKSGIKNTLDEVPAEQLILGMPFYTRVWITDSNGNVTSDAMGMQDAADYLSKNQATISWSDKYGQNYGSFTKDNKTYECWLEDAKSLSLKLQAMDDNKLAGGAFWKLGFEPSSIWDTIQQYIGK